VFTRFVSWSLGFGLAALLAVGCGKGGSNPTVKEIPKDKEVKPLEAGPGGATGLKDGTKKVAPAGAGAGVS